MTGLRFPGFRLKLSPAGRVSAAGKDQPVQPSTEAAGAQLSSVLPKIRLPIIETSEALESL